MQLSDIPTLGFPVRLLTRHRCSALIEDKERYYYYYYLSEIGCSSGILNWFKSYLTDRMQKVVDCAGCTTWKAVSIGVPQGSGFSPRLFNLVRNIPGDCIQFADDVK